MATIYKANNTNYLNVGSAWEGGVVPGIGDDVIWDKRVATTGGYLLGGNIAVNSWTYTADSTAGVSMGNDAYTLSLVKSLTCPNIHDMRCKLQIIGDCTFSCSASTAFGTLSDVSNYGITLDKNGVHYFWGTSTRTGPTKIVTTSAPGANLQITGPNNIGSGVISYATNTRSTTIINVDGAQSNSEITLPFPLTVDSGCSIVFGFGRASGSYTDNTTVIPSLTIGNSTIEIQATSNYCARFGDCTVAASGAGTTKLYPTTGNCIVGPGVISSSTAAAHTLELSGTATQNSITGSIQDGSSVTTVTKTGVGTWVLSGDNSHTGTTTWPVSNYGTVVYNGYDHSSVISMASTATGDTLRGRGTIYPAVTIPYQGTIAPYQANTISNLTTGNLTLSYAASVYSVQILGTQADKITSTGTINLTARPTLTLAGSPSNGATYPIMQATSITGTFAGLGDGSTLTLSNQLMRINYTGTAVNLTGIKASGINNNVINVITDLG